MSIPKRNRAEIRLGDSEDKPTYIVIFYSDNIEVDRTTAHSTRDAIDLKTNWENLEK